MNSEPTPPMGDDMCQAAAAPTPSAEFINAISEFLDTDPRDLLVEMGYYHREDSAVAEPSSHS